jgi:hypothetical protein
MMAKKSLAGEWMKAAGEWMKAAGEWMKANGYKWSTDHRHAPDPNNEKTSSGQRVRRRRMRNLQSKSAARRWVLEHGKQSVRAFVEANRDWQGKGCRFVPGAQPHVAAQITRFGKNMSAARYMLLLTQGTPPSEGMHARHKCGNGHLSCVNPAHLEWGTPGESIGDANIHRALGDDATIEDRCMGGGRSHLEMGAAGSSPNTSLHGISATALRSPTGVA